MRILGIDPGLATVGLGLLDVASDQQVTVIEWLTIQTDAGTAHSERLSEIRRDLSAYLGSAKPDLIVIEKLYFQTNTKSAMQVSEARGVIVETAGGLGVPLLEPSPLQLKLAITGDGKADKRQMQTMLLHLLNLQELPRPDDAADALALAFFGLLFKPELQPA